MGLLQLLFSFKGRLNRQGFWTGISINFAFLFIVVNFFTYSTAFNPIMLFPLGGSLYSVLTIAVKRLHDRNRSGKHAFILVVPMICYFIAPLAGETIIATSDTFVVKDMEAATSHREPQAFSGKTNSEGKVNFIPLIEGVWKLKVIHKEPFEDQKVCQQSANYATLILPVGKARAKLPPKPEHHHH